jgi:hypothetical protein
VPIAYHVASKAVEIAMLALILLFVVGIEIAEPRATNDTNAKVLKSNDRERMGCTKMNVSKDNIAGFMLGISVGVGIGFIVTLSNEIGKEGRRADEALQRNKIKRSAALRDRGEEQARTSRDTPISLVS